MIQNVFLAAGYRYCLHFIYFWKKEMKNSPLERKSRKIIALSLRKQKYEGPEARNGRPVM